jgi:hypothetical protein
MTITEQLINALVPDPEECRLKARQIERAHSSLAGEQLALRALTQAKRWTAVAGGASGAIANPIVMLPAAAGEMGYVLKEEAMLVGVVAAIIEPASLDDPDGFKADVLAILFPSAASQTLRAAAVRAGQATTRTLIRKYVSKDVLKALVRFAAKYLGMKLTQKAILTKAVPLVGGAVGAAWNWIEVERVGRRAIAYYLDEPLTQG